MWAFYKLMSYDSGKPNRRLINYYRRKTTELGYDTKIFITHIVGKEDEVLPHKEVVTLYRDYNRLTIDLLHRIRPYLQKEFKSMVDEELMVDGIFLIMKKH
jgi:hypothetical protein